MTKVMVFNEAKKTGPKKQIELEYYISGVSEKQPTPIKAHEYDNICLLGEREGYDLIMAWDDGRKIRALYLGHWNDGVVGDD